MPVLTILIIRHAEKPGEAWPGAGLTSDGIEDKKSLVIRGWQRAGSWSALFGTDLGGSDYPRPFQIYAANPSSEAGDEPSQRPYETIGPLAARLNLEPVTKYALGQETELAATIVKQTGVVLVAWEHKAIVNALLPAILNGQSVPGVPSKWDGARFDIVLRFDRPSRGGPWSFRQLFPCLLLGDSDNPMS
jgi:hypothetical protein